MPATYVPEVDVVNEVLCVRHVHGLKTIFPPGFLPEKSNDYHEGGKIHIPGGNPGIFQAVYIPNTDCEIKAVNIAFSSYNLEDSYDIFIGERMLVKNSPTIEMAEIEQLELYTKVEGGVPITIQFYNDSATEKYMFYKFITLTNEIPKVSFNEFNWYEDWNGYHINMPLNGEYELILPVPNYLNTQSKVSRVNILARELVAVGRRIAQITWDEYSPASVLTDYIEVDPFYQSYASYARSENVLISNVEIFDDYVYIKFKQINSSSNPWQTTGRINMSLSMTITNRIL